MALKVIFVDSADLSGIADDTNDGFDNTGFALVAGDAVNIVDDNGTKSLVAGGAAFGSIPSTPTAADGYYIFLTGEDGGTYSVGQGLFRITARSGDSIIYIDQGSQLIQDLLESIGVTLGYPNSGTTTVDAAFLSSTGPKITLDGGALVHTSSDTSGLIDLRSDQGDITSSRYLTNGDTGDLTLVYSRTGTGGGGGSSSTFGMGDHFFD